MQKYLYNTEEVVNKGHCIFYLFTSGLQGTSSSTVCYRGASEQLMPDNHRDSQILLISLTAMATTLIKRQESNTARQLSEAGNYTD